MKRAEPYQCALAVFCRMDRPACAAGLREDVLALKVVRNKALEVLHQRGLQCLVQAVEQNVKKLVNITGLADVEAEGARQCTCPTNGRPECCKWRIGAAPPSRPLKNIHVLKITTYQKDAHMYPDSLPKNKTEENLLVKNRSSESRWFRKMDFSFRKSRPHRASRE